VDFGSGQLFAPARAIGAEAGIADSLLAGAGLSPGGIDMPGGSGKYLPPLDRCRTSRDVGGFWGIAVVWFLLFYAYR